MKRSSPYFELQFIVYCDFRGDDCVWEPIAAFNHNGVANDYAALLERKAIAGQSKCQTRMRYKVMQRNY